MSSARRAALCSILVLFGLDLCVAGCGSTGEEASGLAPDGGRDLGPAPGDAGPDGEGGAPDGGGGGPDGGSGEEPDEPRFLTRLAGPAELAALADAGGDVKYLAPVEQPGQPPLTEACYFQNMRLYPWHLQFLRSFPAHADLDPVSYEALVLREATRRWWGGSLRAWPQVLHPVRQVPGLVAFTVYADATDGGVGVEQLAAVQAILAGCAPFAAELLAWLPEDATQQWLARDQQDALAAAGVAVIFPDELLRGVASVTYSAGEGYGYLRRVPPGQPLADYGPRDVLVLASPPNDLTLVAGLVTAGPQNLHSHVNLRLQEKSIPNASVPSIFENELVAALDGLLVHLVARPDPGGSVTLLGARLADAEAFWAARRPVLPRLEVDLEVGRIAPLAELRAGASRAYGAKAANLGELHGLLPAAHRVEGCAIPFLYYASHLRANELEQAVEALLADPAVRTDRNVKRQALARLRERIEDAPLIPGTLDALRETLVGVFGPDAARLRLKLRSSTNVEDLEAISGAGLYASKAGCPGDDEVPAGTPGPSACLTPELDAYLQAELARRRAELQAHPERTWLHEIIGELEEDRTARRPLARALRKVWASLWSERAFDERESFGIDHRLAYMGVAINPSFVLERANAVVVSGLPGGLVRVVSQPGDLDVAQPEDPTAVAEVLTFRREADRAADVRLLVPSSLLPVGQRIWADADLQALAGLVFTVHDHFAATVYTELDPVRLDMEVKIDRDGRVVLKQVRPYVTADPLGE